MEVNNKFVVVKVEDIDTSLTDFQKSELVHLLTIIEDKRKFQGKGLNKYIVVNMDEPYAKIVKAIVETFGSLYGNLVTSKGEKHE